MLDLWIVRCCIGDGHREAFALRHKVRGSRHETTGDGNEEQNEPQKSEHDRIDGLHDVHAPCAEGPSTAPFFADERAGCFFMERFVLALSGTSEIVAYVELLARLRFQRIHRALPRRHDR